MAELTAKVPSFPGGTSVVFTTPWPLRPGTTGQDVDGNEYVFCTFNTVVNAKQPVRINSDFSAEVLEVTGRGPIGVACARGSSDQAGWVQIKGKCMMMIIDAGSGGTQPSPSDAANGPTTLSTSVPTRFVLSTSITSPHSLAWVSGNASTASGIYVTGLTVAQDAAPGSVSLTTATTDASGAHTGAEISVMLNYPQLEHRNYGE